VRAVPRVVQNSLFKHPQSFTAAQRISRGVGYNNCLKSLMISDNYFKIFFVPNNLQLARLGIVAAKRLMPRAVDRNLAKREIRQLFRVHKIKFVAIDIVVMVRKNEPLDKAAKTNSLSKLFSRVVTRCAES